VLWLLLAREPVPDAADWPGRRGLAAVDAVVWPALWGVALAMAPWPTGLIGPVGMALAAVSALGRLHRALLRNHRYRFTTWRWRRLVVLVWLFGQMLRLAGRV